MANCCNPTIQESTAVLEAGKTYRHENGSLYACKYVYEMAAFMMPLESDTPFLAYEKSWEKYVEYKEPRKTLTYWFPVIEGRDLLHETGRHRILFDVENYICHEQVPTKEVVYYYGKMVPVIEWVPLNYEEKSA